MLNPWHLGAQVVYVHTLGTHRKAIHDSLRGLPRLEKVKKLAVMHSTWQIAPPQEPVPPSSKCHMFPSPSQGHPGTYGTCMN
jgi:hypothetical protein